jgi:hypothetical protein
MSANLRSSKIKKLYLSAIYSMQKHSELYKTKKGGEKKQGQRYSAARGSQGNKVKLSALLPNYQPNQTPQEQLGMSEYAHFVLIVADQQHQHFQKIHSRHHITYKGRSSNKSISKRPSAN